MCIFLSAIVLLVSCGQTPPAEHYGFIAKLGLDTVSLESVSRKGNTITSDEVDRFPRVRIRHTVITLAADGSISHLVMDIKTPSEPPQQRERKVIADVTVDSVLLSKTDSEGTVNRSFARSSGTVVAHVPQMYSLYELYFVAALKQAASSKSGIGNPVQLRQFYIDREFDRFPLGSASVRPLGDGKAEITHDWLSGTGVATIDSSYHMLNYSGARTTYDVKVNRLTSPPEITSMAKRFEALEKKAGNVSELSVRDTVYAQIGSAQFSIDYGRPLLRGRKLLDELLPYDRVWRTGANAATQFTTSQLIKLADMQIPAGTYTLWTVPHVTEVDLIVNKQTGQWGTEYSGSYNLGIAKMNTKTSPATVEKFTISIISLDARHGTLVMEWGSFQWAAPIELL